jgi:predicted aspartyl protease
MPVYNYLPLRVNPQAPNQRKLDKMVLAQTGPIMPVEVSIPDALAAYFTQNNTAIPTPVSGQALIDTGASITAVNLPVIQQLGINPVGTAQVYTPQGNATQSLYPIKLTFSGVPITIDLRAVLGSDLTGQNCIALIGRDILSICLVVYNGVLGSFTMSL